MAVIKGCPEAIVIAALSAAALKGLDSSNDKKK